MSKPKIISHRGNVYGPNGATAPTSLATWMNYENNPQHIETVRQEFMVEIDLWKINKRLYLGHDYPEYEIHESFLHDEPKCGLDLLIHAKNIDALVYCNQTALLVFWHQNDDYAITSLGDRIVVYPGKAIPKNSIIMQPEKAPFEQVLTAYAICTDFPYRWRDILCKLV